MAQTIPASALRPVGGFFAMVLDTFRFMFRRPFARTEFLEQFLFVARVSTFPAIMVIIPLAGFLIFILDQLLVEIGAIDLSGAVAGVGVVREVGPIAAVLTVAGAAATAICADLGARTIRDEISAMRVMGINPIQRLVVPRVLAATVVALLINGITCMFGLAISYYFAVIEQGSSAGQWLASLPLFTGLDDFVLSELKATLYGLGAGLVACYRGLSVRTGAKGVGEAVNQTVILSFILLFLLNTLLSVVALSSGLVV